MKRLKKTARGFTLVELLVVIAIVAILAAVVVLIINPVELTKRGRDSSRLTDLANLQQGINIALQDQTGATGASEAILCKGITLTALAPTCSGKSNDSGANTRKTDGTGWVKVDLSAQKTVSVPTLPVDPLNDASFYYHYVSDGKGWEINANLESVQQLPKEADTADGGDCGTRYEVGSKLNLVAAGDCPAT